MHQQKKSEGSSSLLKSVSVETRFFLDRKTSLRVQGRHLTKIITIDEGHWFVYESYDHQFKRWFFKIEATQ